MPTHSGLPSRRFRSPPHTSSNSIDQRASQRLLGKLQCLVGEDRPFRALIKWLKLGYSTNREECTHGDRPSVFLRRISKENDRGRLYRMERKSMSLPYTALRAPPMAILARASIIIHRFCWRESYWASWRMVQQRA